MLCFLCVGRVSSLGLIVASVFLFWRTRRWSSSGFGVEVVVYKGGRWGVVGTGSFVGWLGCVFGFLRFRLSIIFEEDRMRVRYGRGDLEV